VAACGEKPECFGDLFGVVFLVVEAGGGGGAGEGFFVDGVFVAVGCEVSDGDDVFVLVGDDLASAFAARAGLVVSAGVGVVARVKYFASRLVDFGGVVDEGLDGAGDSDYEQHVRTVVESLMGGGFEHLDTIASAIGLKAWIPAGDPARYAKLYGGEGVAPSDRLQDQALAPDGVRAATARLSRLTLEHPDAVIGSSKNLVEAAAKCVLLKVAAAEPVPTQFPALVKAAFVVLELDPASPPGPEVVHKPLRQMLQGLISSSSALAELRNTAGDGHGTTDALPAEELRDVAALIRDTAVMVANLLIHQLERRTR